MNTMVLVVCTCIVGSVLVDATLVTLTTDTDGSLSLNTDALKEVLSKPELQTMPLTIVSIAGAARKGKSFFMNFLLRYLKERGWENPNWFGGDDKISDEGFVWRGGEDVTTLGIQAWDQLFTVTKKNGKKAAILLLDTQGLFDKNTTKDNNVRLFAFSSLASSVQIVNIPEGIEERDLENLQFCVSMASASTDGTDFTLQTLLFLIQNWPNSHETPYGFKGGKAYINRALSEDQREDELKQVREGLVSTFSDVLGFLMPHPGLNVADVTSFKGANKELSKEYKAHLKRLVENLLHPDKLVPKKWNGKVMKPKELLNLLLASNEAFGDGRVPKPENILTVNAKLHYANQFDDSVQLYNDSMQNHLKRSEYISDKDMKELHLQCESKALSSFDSSKKLGSLNIRSGYRSSLVKRLEEEFKAFQTKMELRKKAIENTMKKAVKACLKEYVDGVDKNIGATSVPDSTLVSLHQKYSSHALSTFRKSATSVAAFQQFYEAELKNDIANHFEKVKKANEGKLEEEERQRKVQEELKIQHQKKQAELQNANKKLESERDDARREAARGRGGSILDIRIGPIRIRFP